MRNYNVTVNVGAEGTLSTVRRFGVTAAEIAILKAIHGDDRVTDIRRGDMDKSSHADERARLSAIYGEDRVKDIFGPPGMKLPVQLENDADIDLIPEKEAKSEPASFGDMDRDDLPAIAKVKAA